MGAGSGLRIIPYFGMVLDTSKGMFIHVHVIGVLSHLNTHTHKEERERERD